MTKRAIAERCRRILTDTPAQHEVTTEERELLLELLRHHPEPERRPTDARPITRVVVARWAGSYHTPCFYLHYEDGEACDFSFHKCVGAMTRDDVKLFCEKFGL